MNLLLSVILLVVGTTVLTAQVTYERILQAEKEPGNWLTYSGTYKSHHYSTLDQIKPDIRDFMMEMLMARPGNRRLAEELHDLAENPKFRHEVANARKAIIELDDRIR